MKTKIKQFINDLEGRNYSVHTLRGYEKTLQRVFLLTWAICLSEDSTGTMCASIFATWADGGLPEPRSNMRLQQLDRS